MMKTGDTAKPYPATRLSLWGPLLLWLVLVFVLSSFHKTHIPKSKYLSWDKLAHASEYSVLGYLTARALFFSGLRWLKINYLWITISFGLLYALSDEFHQYFVPGRSSSLWDAAADLVGVILGGLIFRSFLLKGRFGEDTSSVNGSLSKGNNNFSVK
jgi:VanZ family protein